MKCYLAALQKSQETLLSHLDDVSECVKILQLEIEDHVQNFDQNMMSKKSMQDETKKRKYEAARAQFSVAKKPRLGIDSLSSK